MRKLKIFLIMFMCTFGLGYSPAFAAEGDPFYQGSVLEKVKIDQNVETLSGTKTLVISDDPMQKWDPNGSDRDGILPAEADSKDLVFWIYNKANGAGEDITVKNDAAATIVTLGPEMGMMFSCDGTDWVAIGDDGIVYDGVANTITSTGNIEGATLTEGGNAVPNVTDNLSVFAATTSDQLAGVLSDETGSGGGFVRATSPTLVTPVLGAATATSIAVDASATPTVNFVDSDQDDVDVTAAIYANATTVGTGAEVADLYFQAQGAQGTAGTLETFAHWDGSEETLTLTGDVTVTGDATATSLTVARSATPGFIFQDSDCTDSDDNAHIYADATATGAGVEVIDLYFRAQGAGGTPGAMDTFMFWDGSEENLTLDCNLQVVRNTNATKTDSYVVLAADLGKTLIMNSASDKIFTTPSVAAGDIGAHLKFIKIGTGMLTIQMADSDTVGDSGAGDTVYCGGTGKAVIVLELVTATGWAIMSVVNEPSESWITTD